VSIIHWFPIPTLHLWTIAEAILLFPNMHKVLSSQSKFIKSDFMLRIPGMCIDCIIGKQSTFIENDSIFMSTSTKIINLFTQSFATWIGDLVIYHWYNIDIPCIGQPKLSDRLGRCAPCEIVHCQHRVHYQKIISNAVLVSSHCLF